MPSPRKVLLLKRWLNILVKKQALTNEEDSDESARRREKEESDVLVPELNEISEILKNRLYLGGCRVASADRLAALGVTAVVRAITEHEERIVSESTAGDIRLPDHIDVLYVRLADAETSDIQSHFDRVFRFIDAHLKNGKKVLVHCRSGISRSSTLVTAYLISYERLTLRAAYALVKSKRKIVRPNNGFFRQLIEHERRSRDDGRVSVRMILTSKGCPMPDIVYENALMAKLK